MKGMLSDVRRGRARGAFVVLAILALSLSPLRVLCDLGLAHAGQTTSAHQTGHGDSDLCCTSVGDRALVNAATPDLSSGKGVTLLAAALASVLILSGFLVRRPLRLAGAPPPSRSYYARSARLLR
jgi:hypothetical protein